MFAPPSRLSPPPPVYVFDLDDVLLPTSTLFSQPRVQAILQSLNRAQAPHVHAAYQQFVEPDPMLVHRFTSLVGDRLLLTNGSRSHAVASTHALGLLPYLHGIVDANSGVGLKPDNGPYARIELLLRNKYAPHAPLTESVQLPPIVFFDDRLENLIKPKRRGWTTVWITSVHPKMVPSYVDGAFPNVHAALEHFLTRQRAAA